MKLKTLFALSLALLLAPGALAQETATASETAEPVMGEPAPTTADARTAYATAVEEAQAAAAAGDVDGHVRAAETYVRAAEIAMESGDAELEASGAGAMEAAIKQYVDAGDAQLAAADYDVASEHYESASALAERLENAELQAQLLQKAGAGFADIEQFEMALPFLDRAAELAPDNLDLLYVRGVVLSKSGDADGAAATLADLAARAEAAEDMEMMEKARATGGKLYLVRANAAVRAKDYREAIAHLDEAATMLPEDDTNLNKLYASAYYRLGVSQVQAEQLGAARTSLQRALDHARTAGVNPVIQGAQQQLDYIREVQG